MTTYPADDTHFVDKKITKVEKFEKSYAITFEDGWGIGCGPDCEFSPEPGMTARLYEKGTVIRGLFIDGKKIWYRTEDEDDEYREMQLYGADAAAWLARWDSGKSIFSIEMGGLGPGYEQCIQITAAEILRWLLDNQLDASLWEDKGEWKRIYDALDKHMSGLKIVDDLGLSGAQYGAAVSLATHLYRDGPRAVFTNPNVKDRHIQVSKNFPRAA